MLSVVKLFLLCFVAILSCATTVHAADILTVPYSSNANLPLHVKKADEILAAVANAAPGQNVYGSQPSFIDIPNKRTRTRCSSFLTNLLKQSYGWDNQTIRSYFTSTSPTAALYYSYIGGNEHFTRIKNPEDVKTGDVIAMYYPPPPPGSPPPTDTGHIMLVRAPLQSRTDPKSPIVPNTNQWEAVVIDSSSSYHGPTDTRNVGAQGGIGMGVARLYSDKNTGIIVGYTWSLYSNSIYFGLGNRTILVGRLSIIPGTETTTTQTPTGSSSSALSTSLSLVLVMMSFGLLFAVY